MRFRLPLLALPLLVVSIIGCSEPAPTIAPAPNPTIGKAAADPKAPAKGNKSPRLGTTDVSKY